nr:MAG TPA: hypothetical protein [Caudoviricetes sp.]
MPYVNQIFSLFRFDFYSYHIASICSQLFWYP